MTPSPADKAPDILGGPDPGDREDVIGGPVSQPAEDTFGGRDPGGREDVLGTPLPDQAEDTLNGPDPGREDVLSPGRP